MTKLKCPFCQQELRQGDSWTWGCVNDDCKSVGVLCGTKELWQELIRTRKALDVAVDALKLISLRYLCEYADKALDKITALEQKDVK